MGQAGEVPTRPPPDRRLHHFVGNFVLIPPQEDVAG